jgi:hypothetical protein
MRNTSRVMLLLGEAAEEAAPLPTAAYGIITFGIGEPASMAWCITVGLDANPIAEPESFGMDAILVEPDSVFAVRESEYAERTLWTGTGEPTTYDRAVGYIKKLLRLT